MVIAGAELAEKFLEGVIHVLYYAERLSVF
jgi:hypothetical protein